MGTFYPKAGDIKEKWYVVDAKGEVVGRLASRIAGVLRGKNDATFHPAVNPQNHVIVLNADKAVLTGRKTRQKLYHSHSGYPGGYKSETAESLQKRKPGEVLRFAVKGMLPKTSLGSALLTNIRFYTDDKHPHTAQQPETITLTKARSAGAQD
jgi:large subunit ribosomal protein L13